MAAAPSDTGAFRPDTLHRFFPGIQQPGSQAPTSAAESHPKSPQSTGWIGALPPVPPPNVEGGPAVPPTVLSHRSPEVADSAAGPEGDAAATISRLRLELEAARDEVEALHQMLEDLPEIFERKFTERQRAFLDHHEHLLADNRALRDRLYALTPASPPAQPSLPPVPRRSSGHLARTILAWFGRGTATSSS